MKKILIIVAALITVGGIAITIGRNGKNKKQKVTEPDVEGTVDEEIVPTKNGAEEISKEISSEEEEEEHFIIPQGNMASMLYFRARTEMLDYSDMVDGDDMSPAIRISETYSRKQDRRILNLGLEIPLTTVLGDQGQVMPRINDFIMKFKDSTEKSIIGIDILEIHPEISVIPLEAFIIVNIYDSLLEENQGTPDIGKLILMDFPQMKIPIPYEVQRRFSDAEGKKGLTTLLQKYYNKEVDLFEELGHEYLSKYVRNIPNNMDLFVANVIVQGRLSIPIATIQGGPTSGVHLYSAERLVEYLTSEYVVRNSRNNGVGAGVQYRNVIFLAPELNEEGFVVDENDPFPMNKYTIKGSKLTTEDVDIYYDFD